MIKLRPEISSSTCLLLGSLALAQLGCSTNEPRDAASLHQPVPTPETAVSTDAQLPNPSESGWYRLNLKDFHCIQTGRELEQITNEIAKLDQSCKRAAVPFSKADFVMLDCPSTKTAYVVAPNEESCHEAATKIKPLQKYMNKKEGSWDFK